MKLSTARILDKLRKLPFVGQFNPVDIVDAATETEQQGEAGDVLQLKIKTPRLAPQNKKLLTLQEQLQLKEEFILAKRSLENFKDVLRQNGFSVEHYFAYIQNGRIAFNIPNQEHYNLFMRHKNKFSKQLDNLDFESTKTLRRSR